MNIELSFYFILFMTTTAIGIIQLIIACLFVVHNKIYSTMLQSAKVTVILSGIFAIIFIIQTNNK